MSQAGRGGLLEIGFWLPQQLSDVISHLFHIFWRKIRGLANIANKAKTKAIKQSENYKKGGGGCSALASSVCVWCIENQVVLRLYLEPCNTCLRESGCLCVVLHVYARARVVVSV